MSYTLKASMRLIAAAATLSCAMTPTVAEGWLDENGLYRSRPVDVATMKDGSLLIRDDFAGALYRVTYSAP